jgi:SAM-dependent methyltransferase
VTRGIDVSSGMISTFNNRMKDAGLSPERVHAVNGNLFDKADPTPSEFTGQEWQNFDIATVGFGFHHFEDVVHAAKQLKLRLRPGGVLVINDFLEGGDVEADDEGTPIEGSQGNHAVHQHNHNHGHDHSHAPGSKHEHGHHHHQSKEGQHDTDDMSPEFKKKMADSVVVPHFTIEGVKEFFTEAGFVDVDVVALEEKSYMQFAGKKLWRTILIAKGRRPEEGVGKSEL